MLKNALLYGYDYKMTSFLRNLSDVTKLMSQDFSILSPSQSKLLAVR